MRLTARSPNVSRVLALALAALLGFCPRAAASGARVGPARGASASSAYFRRDLIRSLPERAKRFAIVVGVGRYESGGRAPLEGAQANAALLAGALTDYSDFPARNVTLLTGRALDEPGPTKRNILDALERLKGKVGKDGLLVFAFAGYTAQIEGRPYLLPADASPRSRELKRSAIPVNELKKKLKATGAGQLLLILDGLSEGPRAESNGDIVGAAAGPSGGESSETDAGALSKSLDFGGEGVGAFVTLFSQTRLPKPETSGPPSAAASEPLLHEYLSGRFAEALSGKPLESRYVSLLSAVRYALVRGRPPASATMNTDAAPSAGSARLNLILHDADHGARGVQTKGYSLGDVLVAGDGRAVTTGPPPSDAAPSLPPTGSAEFVAAPGTQIRILWDGEAPGAAGNFPGPPRPPRGLGGENAKSFRATERVSVLDGLEPGLYHVTFIGPGDKLAQRIIVVRPGRTTYVAMDDSTSEIAAAPSPTPSPTPSPAAPAAPAGKAVPAERTEPSGMQSMPARPAPRSSLTITTNVASGVVTLRFPYGQLSARLEAGQAHFEGLHEGLYEVTVQSAGYTPVSRYVEVRGDMRATIALTPEPTGIVPSDAGRPSNWTKGGAAVPRTQGAVERFPKIDCPGSVSAGEEFSVIFSLTEGGPNPRVEIVSGATPAGGVNVAPLVTPHPEFWNIDVVITVPESDFEIDRGANTVTLKVPRAGDSEDVRFKLTAKQIQGASKNSKVFISLWRDSRFLAKVARDIQIVGPAAAAATPAPPAAATPVPPAPSESDRAAGRPTPTPRKGSGVKRDEPAPPESSKTQNAPFAEKLHRPESVTAPPPPLVKTPAPLSGSPAPPKPVQPGSGSREAADESTRVGASPSDSSSGGEAAGPRPQAGRAVGLSLEDGDGERESPDMSVLILSDDPRGRGESHIIVRTRNNVTKELSGQFRQWDDFADLVSSRYEMFRALSPRSSRPEGPPPAARSKEAADVMTGFGRELWRRAPETFKKAFWAAMSVPGLRLRTIEIVTDSPLIPWELMRPAREDGTGERDFIGLEFDVGRMLATPNPSRLVSPPQRLEVSKLAVVAPEYTGDEVLPGQAEELRALSSFPGFERVDGSLEYVRRLFQDPPQGIIHFAGHGVVTSDSSEVARYSIKLADGELSVVGWAGMISAQGGNNFPLVFFNACDLGQSQKVANLVDGWAPAVLDSGASGYIGALWPLGDKGAAAFSASFYETLRERIGRGATPVAEVLRLTRRKFLENGDPSFLSYVLYGDPNLKVAGAQQK